MVSQCQFQWHVSGTHTRAVQLRLGIGVKRHAVREQQVTMDRGILQHILRQFDFTVALCLGHQRQGQGQGQCQGQAKQRCYHHCQSWKRVLLFFCFVFSSSRKKFVEGGKQLIKISCLKRRIFKGEKY